MAATAGRPRAAVSAVGGAIALIRKALRIVPFGVWIAAAKTTVVESGSQLGAPRSPWAIVVVWAEPVRLRTRRAAPSASLRRYAMRLPAGAQARSVTSPF